MHLLNKILSLSHTWKNLQFHIKLLLLGSADPWWLTTKKVKRSIVNCTYMNVISKKKVLPLPFTLHHSNLIPGHQCSRKMKRRWRERVLIRELVFLLSFCSLFEENCLVNPFSSPCRQRYKQEHTREALFSQNSRPAALPPHLPPVWLVFVLFSFSDVFVCCFRYFRQRTSVHVIPGLTLMPNSNLESLETCSKQLNF